MTVSPRFYKEISDWNEISSQHNLGYIVYAGSQSFVTSQAHVIAWNQISFMLQEIQK